MEGYVFVCVIQCSMNDFALKVLLCIFTYKIHFLILAIILH